MWPFDEHGRKRPTWPRSCQKWCIDSIYIYGSWFIKMIEPPPLVRFCWNCYLSMFRKKVRDHSLKHDKLDRKPIITRRIFINVHINVNCNVCTDRCIFKINHSVIYILPHRCIGYCLQNHTKECQKQLSGICSLRINISRPPKTHQTPPKPT